MGGVGALNIWGMGVVGGKISADAYLSEILSLGSNSVNEASESHP